MFIEQHFKHRKTCVSTEKGQFEQLMSERIMYIAHFGKAFRRKRKKNFLYFLLLVCHINWYRKVEGALGNHSCVENLIFFLFWRLFFPLVNAI